MTTTRDHPNAARGSAQAAGLARGIAARLRGFHNEQDGQIVVLVMFLSIAFVTSVFLVINTGRTVNHRIETQNAIDASVVSGATSIARGMNYIASNNITQAKILASFVLLRALPPAIKAAKVTLIAVGAVAKALMAGFWTYPIGLVLQIKVIQERIVLIALETILAPLAEPWAGKLSTGTVEKGTGWTALKYLSAAMQFFRLWSPVVAQFTAFHIYRKNADAEASTLAVMLPLYPALPACTAHFGAFEEKTTGYVESSWNAVKRPVIVLTFVSGFWIYYEGLLRVFLKNLFMATPAADPAMAPDGDTEPPEVAQLQIDLAEASGRREAALRGLSMTGSLSGGGDLIKKLKGGTIVNGVTVGKGPGAHRVVGEVDWVADGIDALTKKKAAITQEEWDAMEQAERDAIEQPLKDLLGEQSTLAGETPSKASTLEYYNDKVRSKGAPQVDEQDPVLRGKERGRDSSTLEYTHDIWVKEEGEYQTAKGNREQAEADRKLVADEIKGWEETRDTLGQTQAKKDEAQAKIDALKPILSTWDNVTIPGLKAIEATQEDERDAAWADYKRQGEVWEQLTADLTKAESDVKRIEDKLQKLTRGGSPDDPVPDSDFQPGGEGRDPVFVAPGTLSGPSHVFPILLDKTDWPRCVTYLSIGVRRPPALRLEQGQTIQWIGAVGFERTGLLPVNLTYAAARVFNTVSADLWTPTWQAKLIRVQPGQVGNLVGWKSPTAACGGAAPTAPPTSNAHLDAMFNFLGKH